jgi:transcriptional regulator with XRE-family HTH domain
MTQKVLKTVSVSSAVDVYVGSLVRKRRKELGVSQGDLAKALGLTFQQVQKYERGSNRISASKLYEIADFLKKPVGYFFDGLPSELEDDHISSSEANAGAFLTSAEGQRLAAAFAKLSPSKRKGVMNLVRAILADD